MKPKEIVKISKVSKQVLPIRVSGRERKKRVRNLLLDLAHFKNLLIIFINKYYTFYKENLLNQSILYGLVAKNYTGKYKEKFEEILCNIEDNSELKDLLEKLQTQKRKIDNTTFVQCISD